MNIGIDLDGVVFDTETMFRASAHIYNLKINGKDMVEPERLRFQDRYNWTDEQLNKYFNENMLDIEKHAQVMPYAKQIIKAMSHNNKIFAITNRGSVSKNEIEITKQRLTDEEIVFDKVIYSASNKLKVCQELKIDLMIDDLYDTIIQLANNGVKCLYYRDVVLKHCDHPNVTEVRDWGDICVELVKMGLINLNNI